ncbi:MAG: heme-binding protein, partial [Planctomyces sp.]
LREYSGGVGHGRNDLVLGPDGWIWAIHGDSVDAPAAGTSRDITSPLRDSRRGPVRQEGYVVRISPDGSQSEVVCTGLRNPFGIDFNAAGDAFTYDADNEFDMGTPWYRPTRIWQLSAGLDFGWRVAQGQWPPYFPDRADNSVWQLDTGKGSPTAVMFGSKLNFA